MKLKQSADVVQFLKAVQQCEGDVLFKTYDGDTLNLKSVLCQYVLVVVQKEKEVLDNSYVICEEADQEFLADFLET